MTRYPDPYIAYLVEFHATRDYFECHELLEEYWKEHPEDGYADLWIGLIQIAVGQYHERRGNRRGAGMMYDSAREKLERSELSAVGLTKRTLLAMLEERIAAVESGSGAYADMNLDIEDRTLETLCLAICRERGLGWRSASPMDDEEIIHRHLRRDRSDVIAARAAAKATRAKG